MRARGMLTLAGDDIVAACRSDGRRAGEVGVQGGGPGHAAREPEWELRHGHGGAQIDVII